MKVKCSYCSNEWTSSGNAICLCPNCSQIIICPSSTRKMPHEILQDIIEVYGVQVLSNSTRMQGILADIVQDRKIKRIVSLAIKDNIHKELLNYPNDDIRIESVKYRFASQNSLPKEIADYIVDSFAFALGIKDSIDFSKLNGWPGDRYTTTSPINTTTSPITKPIQIIKYAILFTLLFAFLTIVYFYMYTEDGGNDNSNSTSTIGEKTWRIENVKIENDPSKKYTSNTLTQLEYLQVLLTEKNNPENVIEQVFNNNHEASVTIISNTGEETQTTAGEYFLNSSSSFHTTKVVPISCKIMTTETPSGSTIVYLSSIKLRELH